MQFKDTMEMTGSLKITVTDETGKVKEEREVPNLVVTVGKTFIASRMVGASATVMGYMEVGTSTTAASASDTALGAAIAGSRTALTSGTSASNVATYVTTFAAGVGTGAITEAGIFNAASAGTMLCRTVFSVVNKGANDTMTITWAVTVN
jgi:hypothetical protein